MKTFIRVVEVWVPTGDGSVLTLADGLFDDAPEFGAISRAMTFARGEGLPGHAAVAAAFKRADAIVALEGFVPDDGYRAIQRRVIAGESTSDQAVLIIAQAQAADRALAADPAKTA